MKEKILNTGVKLWHKSPELVTARGIARALGISHPVIGYHFPQGIKNAVAEYAVMKGYEVIIIQLIANNHPAIKNLTDKEKKHYKKRFLSTTI